VSRLSTPPPPSALLLPPSPSGRPSVAVAINAVVAVVSAAVVAVAVAVHAVVVIIGVAVVPLTCSLARASERASAVVAVVGVPPPSSPSVGPSK